ERLPVGFAFEPDQPRRLIGRELVTFVADPIELDPDVEPISGYPIVPRSRSLLGSEVYPILEEGLPWTIPVHRYDSPTTISSTSPSPSGKTPRGGKKSSRTGDT
ncbi:hypothetical protein ACYOEI_36690, partial [Singulisphaera rosea]